MNRWTGALGVVLAFVTVARADEGLVGEWRVDGNDDHDAPRVVATAGPGRVSLMIAIGDQAIVCSGDAADDRLALDGSLSRTPGLSGAIERRDGPTGPLPVEVDVTRLETEPSTGVEHAEARVRVGGRAVRTERWSRPGRARLELLGTTGAGPDGLDATSGGLEVRVRVLGRAQRVTLEIELPPGGGDRLEFYRNAGVPRRVIRSVSAATPLEPGEHVLEWDGRDETLAKRIALAGDYRVRLDSPERRAGALEGETAPETRVEVARAKAIVHAPSPDTKEQLASAGRLGRLLEDEYRVDVTTENARSDFKTGDDRAATFLRRMAGAAAVAIHSHGGRSKVDIGDAILRPQDVDATPSSLKDVHAVFVSACSAGAHDLYGDLVESLLDGGVDVVVAFSDTVFQGEANMYHDALGPRLLRYGMPIQRAVRDAAAASFERWWLGTLRITTAKLLASYQWGELSDLIDATLESSAIKDTVRVRAASDIDVELETLMPPRHGCSTN